MIALDWNDRCRGLVPCFGTPGGAYRRGWSGSAPAGPASRYERGLHAVSRSAAAASVTHSRSGRLRT